MFERFDDHEGPDGFVPDDRFRAGVDARATRLRRRRHIGRAGAGVAAVIVAGVGVAGLYVDRRDEAIDRVDVVTQPSADGAVNILLIGSDARTGEDPAAVGGTRADTIAVLRLDDDGNRLLSIPRDFWDPRSPVGSANGRVNGALADGPQGMIDGVVRTTGIPIDHYIELGFDGFAALVDAVGGLDVAVTATVRDAPTGLALDAASCTTLDGDTALALTRARHLEQFDPGTGAWVVDPTGDLGRIARQQVVLGIALDQLDTDPASLDRYSRLLADHAVVDDGLTLGRLVELGRRLADGPTLVTESLPVMSFQTEGGAAVLTHGPGSVEVMERYGAVGHTSTGTAEWPAAPGSSALVPITAC